LEAKALAGAFGSELERTFVVKEREQNVSVLAGGRIRQEYIRRYCESQEGLDCMAAIAG
jgi:hypothetical protein